MVTHNAVEIRFNDNKVDLLTLTRSAKGVHLTDSVLDINYGHSESFGRKQFVRKHRANADFIVGSVFTLDFHQRLLLRFVVDQNTGVLTIEKRDDSLDFKRMQLIVTRGSANSGEVQKYASV